MLHTPEAKDKGSAARHRAGEPCPRGGEHDWLLTYNAQILMPWLGAETANVCRKCSAIAIVTRPAAAGVMADIVPMDFNITLAAWSMMRVYGRDAVAEARRRADAKNAESGTWQRILAAIDKLQAAKRRRESNPAHPSSPPLPI
jgi:hypothetical protein